MLVSVSFKPPRAARWSDGVMSKPDIEAAAQFVAANARILDHRRFERLFPDGPAADGTATAVRDAVAAYRNPDGGFGHGLEPDLRDPASQPGAIEMALSTLDECDAWDDGLVTGACDWLQAHAPAEGGAVAVLSTVTSWPHAPWWVTEPGGPASLIQTGQIAGTLHARGVTHPWLERATGLMWSQIESLDTLTPYGARGVTRFLDHIPDRQRAHQALERIAPLLVAVVTLDPDAPGETHSPLDLAPLPDSIARSLFSDEVIGAHLDHLAGGQRDDGGWTFNWPAWSPAAELDWRGFMTVSALATLRANGRPPAGP
jgi:hypothetical protein